MRLEKRNEMKELLVNGDGEGKKRRNFLMEEEEEGFEMGKMTKR